MRAVQVVGYHQALELAEVPIPEVTGPFDVVVKIGGAGVCRTDLHILEGQWAEKSNVALPYTIGHENAGWVTAVGSAVTTVAEGDKVIVHPLITCGLCPACRRGDDVHCATSRFPGIDTSGGYAEYLKPRPAAPSASTTRSNTPTSPPSPTRSSRPTTRLTGGAGAEVVAVLRPAGDYHGVGYGENIDVPTIDIVSAEINFIGNLVGSYTDLCELVVLAADGRVNLHTTKYAPDDFQTAIDDLDAGRVRGRAILIP